MHWHPSVDIDGIQQHPVTMVQTSFCCQYEPRIPVDEQNHDTLNLLNLNMKQYIKMLQCNT